MAQQDKLTYEGTFNNSTSGLFKDNTSGDIEAVDHRLQVTNTKDSVPFTLDDSYTWPFPQVTASGTDTYTATLSPAITAYVAGQKFQILFTNANTGAATLNLNAVGALAITKNGATALAAGDIAAGSIKILAYDGTRLQIVGDGATASVAAASETAAGIAELATQAETNAGTDDARIVTPLKLASQNFLAPLASPALTGTPTAPTAPGGTNTTQIATTAFVTAAVAASTNIVDQVSTDVSGATITLNMNSQIQRSHYGSASFATAKAVAMSNTTNSLFFNFFFEITSVSAVLTFPADWISASPDFNGTTWTPPTTGKFEFGGSYNALWTQWNIKVNGPST